MAMTTTIKKKGNEVKVCTTKYKPMENPGRKSIDYSKVYGQAFTNRIYKKIHTINKRFDVFKDYAENNEFNYFITLSAVTPECKKAILKKLMKLDASASFLSLAAWTWETETGDMHYHIMLNSSLSQGEIEKCLVKCNYDIKVIYDQRKLIGYFRKNINDTIYVLKQTEKTTLDVDYADLREKQIEILNCSNILTNSTNLKKTEEIVIKHATDKDIEEVRKEHNCKESYEFSKNGANVKIDKYIKKEEESTTAAIAVVAPKVEESITSTTTTASAPAGTHNFIAKLDAPHKDVEEIMKEQAQAVADEMESFMNEVLGQEENKLKKAESSHKININNIFKKKEWQLCLQKESLIKPQHFNWWTKAITS
jgi:hypothetical protein